jgi:hypothetical protein
MPRRRCRYCRRLFRPNPHVKDRQRSCSSLSCRRQRKAESQQVWLEQEANREYFSGRYLYVKEWLSRPGNENYLKKYRQRRSLAASPPTRRSTTKPPVPPPTPPESPLNKQLADIQDELRSLSRSVSGIQARLPRDDIQDESGP